MLLQGFLFSVTSSPEVILPSEWMPIVFAEQDAGYRNIAEARSIVDELMAVYNDINADVAAASRPNYGSCVNDRDSVC